MVHAAPPTPAGSLAAARCAAPSSVRSIPTGHQVMHLPQPTHPIEPNWSVHAASLWVSHCRYRDLVSVRRLPPWMCANSSEKHESHTRRRSASSLPSTETSATVVQKQVGHTMVQFMQARHREPTSSHSGLSALA